MRHRNLALILFILWTAAPAAADISVAAVGPYVTLTRSLAWANANQTWVFTPSKPHASIYIHVCNNNPTSAHTFTLTVRQTADPNAWEYTSFATRYITDTITGTLSPVGTSACTSGYVATMFAARVAITITAAAGAAGTPDTVDLFVVQEAGDPRGPAVGAGATIQGVDADGAASTSNPVQVAGVDNVNLAQALAVSGAGILAQQTFAGSDGVNNGNLSWGTGTAGGAFPNVISGMVFNGTTWDRQFVCSNSVAFNITAGTTQLVALAAGEIVRICHISVSWDATIDTNLVYGTGVNCGTGTTNLTGTYQNVNSIALDFGPGGAIRSAAGNAVCIVQTGAANGGGVISYAQY